MKYIMLYRCWDTNRMIIQSLPNIMETTIRINEEMQFAAPNNLIHVNFIGAGVEPGTIFPQFFPNLKIRNAAVKEDENEFISIMDFLTLGDCRSFNFLDCKPICELAIKNDPTLFIYMSDTIKGDPDFAKHAIALLSDNFHHVSDELINDEKYCILANENDPEIFTKNSIPSKSNITRDTMLEIAKYNPGAAGVIPIDMKRDVTFALELAKITKFVNKWIPYDMTDNKEFMMECIKISPVNALFVSHRLSTDIYFMSDVYNMFPNPSKLIVKLNKLVTSPATCCTEDDMCDMCLDYMLLNKIIIEEEKQSDEFYAEHFVNPKFKHSFYSFIGGYPSKERLKKITGMMSEITGVTFTHMSDYNNYIQGMENSFKKAKNARK